jgi:hypothetical protein
LIEYACTQIGADQHLALALLGVNFSVSDTEDPTKKRRLLFKGLEEDERILQTAQLHGYSKDSPTHWFRTKGWPLMEAVAHETFLQVEGHSRLDQLELFEI